MKQALVTGGTRGIGAGIVHALASAGFAVTATGVTDAEVAKFGPAANVTPMRLDVTLQPEVDALISSLQRLDVVVNCAGIIQRDGREFEPDGFARTVEVNLIGTMRVCVAAHPMLCKTHGAIVNTASMLSFFGSAAAPGYAASKGGVMQLTKSFAGAWAKDGIRVNAIAPGWIATELTQPLVHSEQTSAAILARTPMGRWGRPEDVGGAVQFLVSEQASFVTGVILPVDGGYAAV
jgi:NAD(P)-dependent dehydrogenase (short-subunit alcohol dehydrogenase family)